jgi:hypothetical protein
MFTSADMNKISDEAPAGAAALMPPTERRGAARWLQFAAMQWHCTSGSCTIRHNKAAACVCREQSQQLQ